MSLHRVILVLSVAVWGASAQSAVIASTGFENEAVATTQYTSAATLGSLSPMVAVPLPNTGPPPVTVSSTAASSTAGDLGFTGAWYNTLGLAGFAEGDLLGVRSETFIPVAYPEGNHGYTVSDPEGTLVLAFEAVPLAAHTGVTVSLDILLNGTLYEAGDKLLIQAHTDVGITTLIDTTGTGIEGVLPEDVFSTVSAAVPDAATTATLTVSFTSDSNTELLIVDAVRFEADNFVLPEPACLSLILPSMMLCGRRERDAMSRV